MEVVAMVPDCQYHLANRWSTQECVLKQALKHSTSHRLLLYEC
jgi:hypothetical protein